MFTLPAVATGLVYTNRSLAALVVIVTLLACSCKVLHCGVPGCSDCSSAVVLKYMHVLALFMLLAIPTEASACTCFYIHFVMYIIIHTIIIAAQRAAILTLLYAVISVHNSFQWTYRALPWLSRDCHELYLILTV